MKFKTGTWLLLLLLILSGAADYCGAAVESRFEQGLSSARAGQFIAAADDFKTEVAVRPSAGTLLNLGIAQWREGRVGEAILCWEQSAWLDPFNPDARQNLKFARSEVQLEPPELAGYELSSTWLPASAWAGILCASLWLAIGMLTLPHVLRLRKAQWHQALAALGLGVFLLSLPPNYGTVTRSRLGIVLEKKTALRLTPTKEAEATTFLTAGEPVRQLRQRGDYAFVRTAHGSGWIQHGQMGLLSDALK